jgi:alpha-tubulin suppressor-like RCC1 family protein
MSSINLWPVLNILKPELVANINYFCVFGKGTEVIIVTKNDKVYAFGENQFGCLGLGHKKSIKAPQIINKLCDQQIIDISYGISHVLALTESGECFSWGLNRSRQLGNATDYEQNKFKKIIKISCGSRHSFVITESGELYGFGDNTYGQIGCGNTQKQLTPIKINGFNNEKIISIACGGRHSIALTSSGKVYSWGHNDCGQLGINKQGIQCLPKKINLFGYQTIKNISCGSNHTLLLLHNGQILAFGGNSFGQLGNGNKLSQWIPVKIVESPNLKEIASNHLLNISVAKADNDYCYVMLCCVIIIVMFGVSVKKECVKPSITAIKAIEEIFPIY